MRGALGPIYGPCAIAKMAGSRLCESFNRQHGRDHRRDRQPLAT
jgi:hypothetical protein